MSINVNYGMKWSNETFIRNDTAYNLKYMQLITVITTYAVTARAKGIFSLYSFGLYQHKQIAFVVVFILVNFMHSIHFKTLRPCSNKPIQATN